MIEIEKKFILSDRNIKALTRNAVFKTEKNFIDTYFDTPDFRLTTHDKWLRLRDQTFELKLPLYLKARPVIDQYEEIIDEPGIRRALKLKKKNSLAEDLADNHYLPFCTLATTRKKFQQGEFNLDLDSAESGKFFYQIGEIELMVSSKSQMPKASKKIEKFAQDYHLTPGPVRGKVLEYLKQYQPDHYQALVKAGIVLNIAD